jgi:hypothetical protein
VCGNVIVYESKNLLGWKERFCWIPKTGAGICPGRTTQYHASGLETPVDVRTF